MKWCPECGGPLEIQRTGLAVLRVECHGMRYEVLAPASFGLAWVLGRVAEIHRLQELLDRENQLSA